VDSGLIWQIYSGTIIIVIRNSLSDDIITKFQITSIAIWNSGEVTINDIVNLCPSIPRS